jgi:hypothetical protein
MISKIWTHPATNAICEVYAMHGTPIQAFANLGMSWGDRMRAGVPPKSGAPPGRVLFSDK